MNRLTLASTLLLLAAASPLSATELATASVPMATALKKTAYAPAAAATKAGALSLPSSDALVFSAPPRESAEEGEAIYAPVTAYLSQALGRKVVYKHPGTWGAYLGDMLKGNYDIVFDGAHFNAYRAEKLGHNILVKVPELHEFAVVVRNDSRFTGLSQMAGRTFCTHAPPNLGTLVLLSKFENPSRQPVITNTDGWKHIYEGVASGRCAAGVIPVAILKKFDKVGEMKVLFRSEPMQNQAFSAGPRLNSDEQAKLAAALVAPGAEKHTERMRSSYRIGSGFVGATNQEYAGLAQFLRNEWGYF